MFEAPGCLFLAKREGSRGFLLSLICQMSKCQTSNVKMSNVKCQMSNVKMSNVKRQMSKCQTSNVKRQMSNVRLYQPRLPRSVSVCPSLGAIVIDQEERRALPRGSSDFISFRPPRPPVTLTLRVICPAPQDTS